MLIIQANLNDNARRWGDRYTRYINIYDTASKVRSEIVGILKGDGSGQIDKQVIAGFLPMPALEHGK